MKKAKSKRQKAKSGRNLTSIIFYFVFFPCLCFCVYAMNFKIQAQSGGIYEITQTVIASGGGQNSANGNLSLDGTIGQPLAGTNSTGGNYNLRGGFWAVDALAPTAAPAGVSGRVYTGTGRGIIRRVYISLTDTFTSITRSTQTNQFGYFRFEEVEVGHFYIIKAVSKNFVFTPDNYTFQLLEDRENVDFTGVRISKTNK